jgi:hypothetical protein
MYRNFHLESTWPELLAARPAERRAVTGARKQRRARLGRLAGAAAWWSARRAHARLERRER